MLEEQEQQGMAIGEALLKVQEGLINGRKWLWDEAARKLGMLLSSPAAFEGEHFLQVNTVPQVPAGCFFCPAYDHELCVM